MNAVKILHTIAAAPDNVHTRTYEAGEVYEIDKVYALSAESGLPQPTYYDMVLMPQWLADALCNGGHMYVDKDFVVPTGEGITHVPMKETPAATFMKEEVSMVSKEKTGKGNSYKAKQAIKAPKPKSQAKAQKAQKGT